MEIGCQEEIQSELGVERVSRTTLIGRTAYEDGDNKHQHIDDEQVARNCWYVSHHSIFLILIIIGAKVRKNPVILHKIRVLNTKFQKKITFFTFLFVFLK